MGYSIDGFTVLKHKLVKAIAEEDFDALDTLFESSHNHWLGTSIAYGNGHGEQAICDVCEYLGSAGLDRYYLVPSDLVLLPYLEIDLLPLSSDEVRVLMIS